MCAQDEEGVRGNGGWDYRQSKLFNLVGMQTAKWYIEGERGDPGKKSRESKWIMISSI